MPAVNNDPTPAADGTPAPSDGVESIASVDTIASDLAGDMPEVQEHAIAQAAANAQNVQSAHTSASTDKSGTSFDPSVHATNEDGSPKLTVRGTFALKRGRKTGTAPASKLADPRKPGVTPVVSDIAAQQVQSQQAARMAGIQAANLVFAAGVIIGGEEWRPRIDAKIGLDEKAMMEGAMGDYFVAAGKTDIPPGVVLSFVMLAYAAPRLTMPQTRSRFGGLWAKAKAWYVDRKMRKMGMGDLKVTPRQPAENAKTPEKK